MARSALRGRRRIRSGDGETWDVGSGRPVCGKKSTGRTFDEVFGFGGIELPTFQEERANPSWYEVGGVLFWAQHLGSRTPPSHALEKLITLVLSLPTCLYRS